MKKNTKKLRTKKLKTKKLRIKNTRENKFYLIMGRILVNIGIYAIVLQASVKVLEFVVCNCITTIK